MNFLVNLKHNLESLYYKNKIKKFNFEGKEYNYFFDNYHATWTNERKVELPIFLEYVKNKKNILEIGNVLNHYGKFNHTVLDKYEIFPDVINEDIVDYNPKNKFDHIISISTFEHVGINGGPNEDKSSKDKAVNALKHALTLLKKGGTIYITFPVGYNLELDKYTSSMIGKKNVISNDIKIKSMGLTKKEFNIRFFKLTKL